MTERAFIERAFTVDLAEGDGRTIIGRCVPYGEVATVADEDGRPYKEAFARGAFRRATAGAPQHVILDFEHQRSLDNVVGQGVEFVERADGLHGVFRARPDSNGDRALGMIQDGVLTGLSVRAMLISPGRRDGDVIVRTHCHLDRVALVREPAYAGAGITAVRAAAMVEPLELSALRPPRDLALDERLRALGIGVVASPTE